MTIPNVDQLKLQAKRLRSGLASDGTSVTHSQALELIAGQYGFADWNTLVARAAAPADPVALTPGMRVSGAYLGQKFEGRIVSVQAFQSDPGRQKISLHFDKPVDVVSFDSFSAFRQRVSCTIDRTGRTLEKTSDGRPHLVLDRIGG